MKLMDVIKVCKKSVTYKDKAIIVHRDNLAYLRV